MKPHIVCKVKEAQQKPSKDPCGSMMLENAWRSVVEACRKSFLWPDLMGLKMMEGKEGWRRLDRLQNI